MPTITKASYFGLVFRKLISILVLPLLILPSYLFSQVNIKVGYGLGFPQLSATNNLLDNYLPPNSEVVETFGAVNFMHGIQLGIRYKIANTGIEAGWETMTRDLTSLAYMPSSDSFTDRTYGVGFSGLHIGLDHYFDKYGLGLALHGQKLTLERRIGNNDLALVDQRKLALRINAIWTVQESEVVSLAIKPYYQLPLGDFDVSRFADDIGSAGTTDDGLSMFGLSFVFYNGRQYN